MATGDPRRFVTADEMEVEVLPWGPHEWLCRPGLTDARDLLLVRVRMPPGKAHAFHRHPEMEEIALQRPGRRADRPPHQRSAQAAGYYLKSVYSNR